MLILTEIKVALVNEGNTYFFVNGWRTSVYNKQGLNTRTKKVVKSEIKLGLSFILVYTLSGMWLEKERWGNLDRAVRGSCSQGVLPMPQWRTRGQSPYILGFLSRADFIRMVSILGIYSLENLKFQQTTIKSRKNQETIVTDIWKEVIFFAIAPHIWNILWPQRVWTLIDRLQCSHTKLLMT